MSDKLIEPSLYVHIERKDGVHLVGQVQFNNDGSSGFGASFQYDQSWIKNPDALPLDPINLPLGNSVHITNSENVKLGVLMDAGPDMWGRKVFKATHSDQSFSEQALLLYGSGNGSGALLFSTEKTLKLENINNQESIPLIKTSIDICHESAHTVIKNIAIPNEQQAMLAGSWSIGGARSKKTMRDDDGRQWIVKFSEPNELFDKARTEYANLAMAKAIGLNVPLTELYQTAFGSALAVERFDRTLEGRRLHYISARSLISADPDSKRLNTLRDRTTFSYTNIARIISKVSPEPSQHRKELFAQMALNVCLHNTDDHSKNFGFTESKHAGAKYLDLSKVFDVVTQGFTPHHLRIGTDGREGTIANVLSEHRQFGLTEKGAASIVDQVVEVVANRRSFYENAGLSEYDQGHLERLVGLRCPQSKQQATLAPPSIKAFKF